MVAEAFSYREIDAMRCFLVAFPGPHDPLARLARWVERPGYEKPEWVEEKLTGDEPRLRGKVCRLSLLVGPPERRHNCASATLSRGQLFSWFFYLDERLWQWGTAEKLESRAAELVEARCVDIAVGNCECRLVDLLLDEYASSADARFCPRDLEASIALHAGWRALLIENLPPSSEGLQGIEVISGDWRTGVVRADFELRKDLKEWLPFDAASRIADGIPGFFDLIDEPGLPQ